MPTHDHFPYTGVFIALITFIALVLVGIDFIASVAVLLVWIGSLVLVTSRPPEMPEVRQQKQLSSASIAPLIEDSSTPLLIIEGNTISLANKSARKLLGHHIIGQDARMAFRQPQAISLLSAQNSSTVVVRGLVRRRDIWQINRQIIDEQMSVLELINQTAEADISRAHTDFVANASHELRTPLAGIIGYVETLSESDESLAAKTPQKFLATILREAHRMQSLVSDLMSLSRIEAEKHELPDSVIEFSPLIERASKDAAGPAKADRLMLRLEISPLIQGDAFQLEQLVRNLVDNALKYGAEDGPVTVSLEATRDDQIRFTVSNTGEGIPAEHIPHLTRRFYRTDPGRSRASGGTGLGLAIVKHIVERHRGRLDIHSEAGKGTSVIIRLPAARSTEDGDDGAETGEAGLV